MVAYLKALAEALPPPDGKPYTLTEARFGSDLMGWEPALILNVEAPEPVYLVGRDLEKSVEQLVRETIDTIHRAAEVKRKLAEFDQMTGGH